MVRSQRLGGLKYWLTTPGRYTLAEAFYLNRQDMLHWLDEQVPAVRGRAFPYPGDDFDWERMVGQADSTAGRHLTDDELGFFFDRDVLACYGDPAWEVRLRELPAERDFEVTQRRVGSQYEITVTTAPDFSAARMAGDRFKEEHVGDLPFSCFFPERLKNPRLAGGQTWHAPSTRTSCSSTTPASSPGGATASCSTSTAENRRRQASEQKKPGSRRESGFLFASACGRISR